MFTKRRNVKIIKNIIQQKKEINRLLLKIIANNSNLNININKIKNIRFIEYR